MNRHQLILAAGLFAVGWGTNVSTPLILRYQDRLDLSDTGAVGIFTVYVLGILITLLFAGRLSDRLGRRPIVLPFTLLSAIASLIMIFGRDSLEVLFFGRFLLGAVSGAVLSVGTAWLAELTSERLDAVARVKLATVTATVIYMGFGFGPTTSAVYDKFGEAPLVIPYVGHAVATVVVLGLMATLPETKPADPTVSLRPQLGIPEDVRADFISTLAPAGIWVFGFPSVAFALFPVILRDAIGGDNDVLIAGIVGTVTAFAALLARPTMRRIGDPRSALVVAMWVGVVGYAIGITAFVSGVWQIVPFAAVTLGAASAILIASGLALTEAIADESNRGALNATFYLVAYSGMTMPVVITLLARPTSVTAALSIIASVALGVAVLLTMRPRPAVTA